MVRKQTHYIHFLILCIFVFTAEDIQAQSQKKLQKLVNKHKYEKLIEISQKRISNGVRDSISYYYLTLGHLLKSEYSTGTTQDRNYFSATKTYEKLIANTDNTKDSELQSNMLKQGYEVYNQLDESKKRRRKHYASFFAEFFADTVPDYSILFPENRTIITESTITETVEQTNITSNVQKTVSGIPYKIPNQLPSGTDIVKAAETSIGTPWVWAGMSPTNGFDCSGFIVWSYQQLGYELPHRTKLLAAIGTHVQANKLQPSDIVCFGSNTYDPSTVWHVGMIHSIEDNKVNMIHCGTSTGVAITTLSSGYWSESSYFVIRINE